MGNSESHATLNLAKATFVDKNKIDTTDELEALLYRKFAISNALASVNTFIHQKVSKSKRCSKLSEAKNLKTTIENELEVVTDQIDDHKRQHMVREQKQQDNMTTIETANEKHVTEIMALRARLQQMTVEKLEEVKFMKELEIAKQNSLRDTNEYIKRMCDTGGDDGKKEESMRDEFRKLKEIVQDSLCRVCFENRPNAFIKCYHVCMCMGCATTVPGGLCPICRVKYEKPVELIFS